VIEADCNTAGVTFSTALPETEPDVALIVVAPADIVCASPELDVIAATVGVSEVHTTLVVRSTMLVSENIPVAVNCCDKPFGVFGLLGVTVMDSRLATKDTRAISVVPVNR
jgi:hypothetical protein